MNFKKRVNGSWHDTPHYIHNTSTDTITTLPAVLYPTGTTATVGLKGNTVQSTTPTPQNPVMPNGTGERTGNLFDVSKKTNNVRVTYTTGETGAMPGIFVSDYTPVEPNKTYTLNIVMTINGKTGHLFALYDANKNFVDTGSHPATSGQTVYTFTIPDNIYYIRFNGNMAVANETMLNSGSQPLPYEQFGYKIPISSAGQTTPAYLGEVETVRKIWKWVLTGNETWYVSSTGSKFYSQPISTYTALVESGVVSCACSHYDAQQNVTSGLLVENLKCAFRTNLAFYIGDDTFTTPTDFKSYLAAQYTAGTPVTVWYVLATPTTGIVNEPLMKIGTYADEVSNVSIPVTAGGDTISVDTTLQPSEVTVNYKGWHPITDAHERENGAWT